jgi:putative membrane protein
MARLLSESDEQQIAERIAGVERQTAGELVVIVAAQSSAYDRQRAFAAALATFLLALAVYLFVPHVPGAWVISGQAPVFVGLYALAGMPALLRLLVPDAVRELEVSARAKQLFIERGVTETRDRSGVLVFLSEAERRLEIVADKGVHERVGSEGWQRMLNDVVGAIRAGAAGRGVLGAVDAIGGVLREHFPPRPDDVNELPDAVVRV